MALSFRDSNSYRTGYPVNGFSLVVPFYNEEEVLESTLEKIHQFLPTLGRPYELILGDDGSKDRSSTIATAFASKHPETTVLLRNDRNRGRGSILTKAFSLVKMPIVAYIDADLEISLRHLPTLLKHLDNPKIQIVTGTKLRAPQPLNRARHRQLASIVFNFLIHQLLHSPVSDHQCGLKGFQRAAIQTILKDVREEGWAWDTEVLLLAQKKGFCVEEFTVELESRRRSKVPFFRTIWMFSRKILEFRKRGLAL